ncbi:PEP-CTERM/exosortase system-associated acyltransferase [Hydrocarboniclastica marina]|uniref:PEP-CTERM/exosortase system-associated acyltransferase n=1 Tax=Hydrocarboniclastica marina TaxID=2259620 RepID=A0A4P7XKJ7_9ALTE|nr:PEP-CTERM/exosortase system-associated acyltransferase [Hydrocarboniclastica marina]QCF27024.1 PEP-CTERM/exosortase system-associated acyltransferase [Hydrocarboniclastica marina]
MNEVSNSFYKSFDVEMAESPRQVEEAYELRYDVYCLDREFENAQCFPDKREHDEFDRHSVHGLVRHTRTGKAIAGVRLVMSRSPHERAPFPMEGACLEALTPAGRHVLRSTPRAQVAELSRFAVSREFRRRLGELDTPSGASDRIRYIDQADGHRNLPYITLGLFAAIVRLSDLHGITHWMAVMEPALLRLLQRFGIRFKHVGHIVNYHGRRKPVFDEAAAVLEGIRRDRPDVWAFITDDGRYFGGSERRDHDVRSQRRG